MPQPTLSQVHINAPLTNILTAYMQDAADFVAAKVFPVVPVEKKSDLYFTLNKNDWLRSQARKRADATESAGGGFGVSTANYNCEVFAFHKDVGDQIRANADSPLDMDRDASLFVGRQLLLAQEQDWAAQYFTTGVWGTDVVGGVGFTKWSDYAGSNPLLDIKTARSTIKQNTGYAPNKLVLGYQVFETLVDHPMLVDRYKYTNAETLTKEMIARLFQVDEVIVASAVQASNDEGATASYGFIAPNSALLCYVAPKPGILVPSAGYTFMWKGVSGGLGTETAVKSFYMNHLAATRIEGEAAWSNNIVGSDLGYFLSAAI